MVLMRRVDFWLGVFLAVASIGLGSLVMFEESASNVRGGNTQAERIAAMPDGESPVGLTAMSQRTALFDCEVISRKTVPLQVLMLPEDEQSRLPETCLQMSAKIAHEAPTNALAWLVNAAAAAKLGDYETYNQSLAKSALSGRNEVWVASLRAPLISANYDQSNGETRAIELHDMAIVGASVMSAPTLVGLYLTKPDFKARMQSVLAEMTPEDQQTFIFAVRRGLAGGQ